MDHRAADPDALIYGMLKALYNPANRAALQAGRLGTHFMDPVTGAINDSAMLHPGAARYFTETALKAPVQKAALPVKRALGNPRTSGLTPPKPSLPPLPTAHGFSARMRCV